MKGLPSHQVTKSPEIILALDVNNLARAKYFVNKLYPKIKIFKVGLELFTACGPKIIDFIQKKGAGVFLDLKFHDIPNTMAAAAKKALQYKVAMLTVHTLAGPEALKAVVRVCSGSKTKVLGVTILTSICAHFLKDLQIKRSLGEEVLYLAKMARRCGLDGVVCSPDETKAIRGALGKNFLIVTPGIRPQFTAAGDQKRIATPALATKAGSNFLVIGRPVLEAKDPLFILQKIVDSIRQIK
ncbi:MAG: orotidine-5'-phosphate decarboxylase [Candidatus Omnitrophota bacterium]|nr:MAG: orotidine-5'-phosphate decarboxylase [Candidatus Omnitrophota bacterium]